jgi:histidinol-phosphate aminotransferase
MNNPAPEIRLDANEFPLPLPDDVMAEVVEAWKNLGTNRYPDPGFHALRRELAESFGLAENEVTCGVGGDELIENLMLAFTPENGTVVYPEPTFSSYPITGAALRRKSLTLPMSAPFALEREKLLALRGDLLFLVWPNNPTGVLYPEDEVFALLRDWPGVSILDESYWEFSGASLLARRAELPRTLFLRTFSKGLRLAGLRVGYVFGPEPLIRKLHRQKLYYNLPAPSIEAARIAWRHRESIWRAIPEVRERRDRFIARLNAVPGLTAYPSVTNFFLLRVAEAPAVHEKLLASGVRVRRFHDRLAPDHLRISVGTETEMETFLARLKEVLA